MALQSLSVFVCCILICSGSISTPGETDAYEVEDEVVLAYAEQQRFHIDMTHLVLGGVITGLAGLVLFSIYTHGKNIEHHNDTADLQDSTQNIHIHYQEEIGRLKDAHKQEIRKYIDDHKDGIGSMLREKDSLNIKIQDLQNRLTFSSESAAIAEKQYEEKRLRQQAEIRKLQERLCQLEGDISMLKRREHDFKKEVERLQRGKEIIVAEDEKLKDKFRLTQSQLLHDCEESKQSLENTKVKLKEAESKRSVEVRELQYRLNELEMKKKQLQNDLHAKEEECEAKESECNAIKRMHEEEKCTILQLRNKKQELEKKCLSMSTEIEKLKDQVAKISHEEQYQSGIVTLKQEKIKNLQEENHELRAKNSALEIEVKECHSKVESLTFFGINVGKYLRQEKRHDKSKEALEKSATVALKNSKSSTDPNRNASKSGGVVKEEKNDQSKERHEKAALDSSTNPTNKSEGALDEKVKNVDNQSKEKPKKATETVTLENRESNTNPNGNTNSSEGVDERVRRGDPEDP